MPAAHAAPPPALCTDCTLAPANATICTSDSVQITLGSTGPPATATGWVYSTTTDDLDEYTDAPNTVAENSYWVIGLAPGTYYFRALVNGGADTTDVSTTVTVVADPVPGTLSSPGSYCAATPGGTDIELQGHTGTVVRWEQRTTTGTWAAIPASAGLTTYSIPAGITDSLYYRAIVGNGTCDLPTPEELMPVTPNPVPGTLSNPGIYCETTPGGTAVALQGHTGTVVRWEQRTTAGAWATIPATAGITAYTIPAGITDSLYYRAIVANGTCDLPTPEQLMPVNPAVAGGTLTGGPNESCGNTGIFTLTLAGQTGTVMRWERRLPTDAAWTNLGLPMGTQTYEVNPGSAVTYEYRVLVMQPACGATYSNTRTISVFPTAAVGTAQTDATQCSGTAASLFVDSYTGSLQWQQRVPPDVVFTNVTGPGSNSQVYLTPALTQTTVFRAVSTSGPCDATSNEVTITITPAPVAGNIPAPAAICSGETTTLSLMGATGDLQWQSSPDGTTDWTDVTDGTGATTNSYTTAALTATRYYRVQVSTGCNTVFSNVVGVQVGAPTANPIFPAPAAICSGQTTAGLGATLPAGTTGSWSCTGCLGGFTSGTNPNAQYVSTVNETGTIDLVWTVNSPGCAPTIHTRSLNIQAGPQGSFPNTPPATCYDDATPPLGAAVNTGTGAWSVIPAGAGAFSSPTDPNATFTPNAGSAGSTLVLRWTVSAGGCPDVNYNQNLVVADDPLGGITTATLAERCVGEATPSIESFITQGRGGFWSSNGSGTFAPNNSATTVTYTPSAGDGGNTVGLTWNVVNGTCDPATYSIPLEVVGSPIASVPGAALDTICAGASTVPLGASATNGTGGWSCQAYWDFNGLTYPCSGFFDPSPTAPNARYVSSSGDWDFDITLTWTVSNDACPDDDATREFYVLNQFISGTFPEPMPASVCKGSRLGPLNATNQLGTIGTWTCVGCDGGQPQFRNAVGDPAPNDPNAYYHALPGDASTVTLRWTISNNNCTAPRILERNISIEDAPVASIPVGVPPVCADTPVRIFANSSSGVGFWSTSTGNGTFVNANATTTFFRAAAEDGNDGSSSLVDLIWTATDAGCPDDQASTPLTVFRASEGSIVSVPDTICLEETAPLSASLTWGTGLWLTDGNGGFTNSTSPNAQYIPLLADTGQLVEVAWVVTNGSCASETYRDTLYVRRQSSGQFNTLAPAICEGQTSIPLNAEATNGMGSWSANGSGTFSDANDPNATYTAGAGDGLNSPITLTWTVQNGSCLTASYSQVIQVFPPSAGDFAVNPAPICLGGQSEPLQAQLVHGQGRWRTPNGSGTFSNPNDPNARYISGPADADVDVELIWRVGNGTCDSVDYQQSLFVNNIEAAAGPDVTICVGGSTQLQASGGTDYLWLPATGLNDNTIANPIASPTGNTTYTVTVGDGSGCFFTDQVTVSVSNNGAITASVNNTPTCVDTVVTLTATGNNLDVSTFFWSPAAPILAAGGNPNSLTTTAALSTTTTFTATAVTNTGCMVMSQVEVQTYPVTRPTLTARDNCENEKQFLLAQDVFSCQQIFWFDRDMNTVRAAGPLTEQNPHYVGNDELFLAQNEAQIGSYVYTLLCQNNFGCGSFDQRAYDIILGPNGDFTADRRAVPYREREIQFTSTDLSTPPDITRYYWDFGDPNAGAANNSTDANPTHSYSTFGTYTVALYVSTDLNCSDLIIKTNYISVQEPIYKFPTAFTPNGDGVNDRFRALPADGAARIERFRIYDRWDQMVYETRDPNGWDGNSLGGRPMDAGVYTYDVVIELPELGRQAYNGLVHLLR